MKELEYLSAIWYAGCLDMCLVVSERISKLDNYFLIKKLPEVDDLGREKTGITVCKNTLESYNTW